MAWKPSFRPKLVDCLRDYNRGLFVADLTAGLVVGIVALPLAMAFGIASGVSPQAGLFTAVVAGFIISAFGGSRVQIGGPTGAFVIIVYGIIAQYGLPSLLVCTMMAGVILIVMGFAGMGRMIEFIPFPVTMGFTNGIAVLIFTTQIKDLFGLQLESVPADFVPKMAALFKALPTAHWPTLLLGAGSIALIRFWPKRFGRRVPGSIVAVIVGTVLVAAFGLPVETIGSRFGGIPQGLPPFAIPEFDWGSLPHLIRPATTIAVLAAIESLLSAVVADGMIEDHHDSNQELIAQGIANICTPLVGGIPATGAIARTATNVRSGATSPVSGIVHAATLLAILLAAAPMAKFIPLVSLGAVLVIVALNMGEWREFRRLRQYPKSDGAVFLTTFGLTVIFDLTIAVEVGMVLAAVLFIKRVAEVTEVNIVTEANETEIGHHSVLGKDIPAGVLIYRVHGALFFGAAQKLETALLRSGQEPRVMILRLRTVMTMDSTAVNAIEGLCTRLEKRHVRLILSGTTPNVLHVMEHAGFLDQLGRENLAPNIEVALQIARDHLAH